MVLPRCLWSFWGDTRRFVPSDSPLYTRDRRTDIFGLRLQFAVSSWRHPDPSVGSWYIQYSCCFGTRHDFWQHHVEPGAQVPTAIDHQYNINSIYVTREMHSYYPVSSCPRPSGRLHTHFASGASTSGGGNMGLWLLCTRTCHRRDTTAHGL